MRVLALDLGDTWTGTALSDPLKIIATPYKSVKTEVLIPFLHELFQQEKIDTVVIGYPRTMRDTESEQTKKVVAQKEIIEKEFPMKKYILWDERLSSKGARIIQGKKAKTQGHNEHSIAAAIILQTYLQFLN
ncbi:MAG TPA: Holliday junction resolvase RuvX [Candidatus Saccharimonadales bacterium]|nr:Holliday junction resolvase RuvX [Candidatus Saccharimonadales bacterium]